MTMQEYTIVISDRNPNVREFLRREFTGKGFVVLPARDGWELFRLFRQDTTVHLLVLDPEIPSRYGAGLLERISREMPKLPVILHALNGWEAGKDGTGRVEAVVEKQPDTAELVSTAVKIINRRYRIST